LIDVLVLNFKAMLSAQVKVRKKDFCIVFVVEKLQKCHERAALKKIFFSYRKHTYVRLWAEFANFFINISSHLILS